MYPFRQLLTFIIAPLLLTSCLRQEEKIIVVEEPQWIDLTHPFDSTTLYWPNNPTGFVHKTDAEGITPLGYFYSSYSVCAPEHGGTHLDAPVHFAEGKETVDEIPLEHLTGEAVVVDVSERALKDRDYLISVSDMEAWEKSNGTLAPNTIVLFRTGYGKFYPDREKYFGTSMRGPEAIPLLHFPGIDPSCAEWLVKRRNIKAVGLDTPSMDYGQSKDFRTHQVICGNNVPGFENVANLDRLPEKGIRVIALPMKIGKGSGAPLRIIASVMKELPKINE
ncbi:MAG: hypothetical protein RL213_1009 [Bacteroidota bacterium]|jgi:kynurenine formamidase